MYKLIATVLSILASGVVVAEKEVILKAEVVEVIFLECKINGIFLGVEFITPQGSSYGSCNPPVPPEIDKNLPLQCGNNITQYLGRNTTVLLLEKSDKWLGVWTCKHGHSHSLDTVNITRSVFGQDIQRNTSNGVVRSQDHVCLKVKVTEDAILLECKINKTVLDVHFYSPDNTEIGSCSPPPTPEHRTENQTNCGNNITQYFDEETTTLRLEKSQKWIGEWMCKHGSARSFDRVNITACLILGDMNAVERHDGIDDSPFFLNCLLCYLLLLITIFVPTSLVICWKIRQWWTSKTLFVAYEQVNESDDNSADQNEEITDQQGVCSLCNRPTSFAFCYCKNFFCENCSHVHNRSFQTHHIVQIRHKFENHEDKLQCKTCLQKSPQKVCKECIDVYCKDCICVHESHLIKPIVHDQFERQIPVCSEEYIQIEKPILKHKLKMPLEKAVISGMANIKDVIVAAIDYENCTLHVFNQIKCVYFHNLKMEPKALTKLGDGKIAITFAYKKLIRIFKIQHDKAVEIVPETIILEDLGKPFNISFSKGYFAVEIGEGKRGFIAIIDTKGKVFKRIPNKNYSFGYFTSNNIRLCLDMEKECFYTSAIGKQSVYCVDFKGTIKWHVTVPSPRELQIVQTNPDVTHILFASNRGNAVYQLKGKDEDFNTRNPESRLELESLHNPECISYNKENKLLYVGMEDGRINVYYFENGL